MSSAANLLPIWSYSDLHAKCKKLSYLGGGMQSVAFEIEYLHERRALVINTTYISPARFESGKSKFVLTNMVQRLQHNARRNPHIVDIVDAFFFQYQADRNIDFSSLPPGEFLQFDPQKDAMMFFATIEELGEMTLDKMKKRCEESSTSGLCNPLDQLLQLEMCDLSLYSDGIILVDDHEGNYVEVPINQENVLLGDSYYWCYRLLNYSLHVKRPTHVLKRIDLTDQRASFFEGEELPTRSEIRIKEANVIKRLTHAYKLSEQELLQYFAEPQNLPPEHICDIIVVENDK